MTLQAASPERRLIGKQADAQPIELVPFAVAVTAAVEFLEQEQHQLALMRCTVVSLLSRLTEAGHAHICFQQAS